MMGLMQLKQKACRCCGARDQFKRLDKEVEVDPFFAKYGLQLTATQTATIPWIDWGLRRKVNSLPANLGNKIHRRIDHFRSSNLLISSSVTIPYGLCEKCDFLAPWYEITDDQLRDYYSFYLDTEYIQARSSFQPGFAELSKSMGSAEEAALRRRQHEEYLMPILENYRSSNALETITLLDYGGGEGGIQPKADWISTSIIEVSSDNEPKSNQRLESLSQKQSFDVVQCLHVIEHVGHPLNICRDLLSHCKDGGLLYIEVPIEFPGLEAIAAGKLPPCHEHINKLSQLSIRSMLERCEVEIIEVRNDHVDFLHLDGLTPVVRGLGRVNRPNINS
jgi:SAM-dependent methyltransferase